MLFVKHQLFKFNNLLDKYKKVCNDRDGLKERIQIIIESPEYQSFRERERREGNKIAQKNKEAWNLEDNTDDEFPWF